MKVSFRDIAAATLVVFRLGLHDGHCATEKQRLTAGHYSDVEIRGEFELTRDLDHEAESEPEVSINSALIILSTHSRAKTAAPKPQALTERSSTTTLRLVKALPQRSAQRLISPSHSAYQAVLLPPRRRSLLTTIPTMVESSSSNNKATATNMLLRSYNKKVGSAT